MRCIKCGADLAENETVCSLCGQLVETEISSDVEETDAECGCSGCYTCSCDDACDVESSCGNDCENTCENCNCGNTDLDEQSELVYEGEFMGNEFVGDDIVPDDLPKAIDPSMNSKSASRKLMTVLVVMVLVLAVAIGGLVYYISKNSTLLGITKIDDNPETVLAKVNGEEITRADYNAQFEPIKAQYEGYYGPDVWTIENEGKTFLQLMKETLIDSMIDEKLILKDVADKKIVISEEEIDANVAEFKTQFESEEKFTEYLTAQAQTIEQFREESKTILLREKMYTDATADTTVSDEDVKKYYDENPQEFEQITASHILLETQEKADEVLGKIKAGGDFVALAKEFSTDSAETGGELGTFGRGAMIPAFEEVAFALNVGDVSEVVATEFGFHIIKVTDKSTQTYDDSKEALKTKLLDEAKKEAYSTYIEGLRSKAKIKKYLNKI